MKITFRKSFYSVPPLPCVEVVVWWASHHRHPCKSERVLFGMVSHILRFCCRCSAFSPLSALIPGNRKTQQREREHRLEVPAGSPVTKRQENGPDDTGSLPLSFCITVMMTTAAQANVILLAMQNSTQQQKCTSGMGLPGKWPISPLAANCAIKNRTE